MEEIVRVKCIKHVYPDTTVVGLCGLDLTVHSGERVVLLGPNGSGKTTLLAHVLGLLTPVEGQVRVFGLDPARDFAKIRPRIGVVLQDVDHQIIGPTVWDDIALGLRNQELDRHTIAAMVEDIMERMGITHLKDKIPHYLSGGEKKKLALASAMVTKPQLLVLDEPFNGLDSASSGEIVELLSRLHADYGTAMLITTHDVNRVPSIADTVYVIDQDGSCTHGTPRAVLSRPDLLRKAKLEPPVLVQLFQVLVSHGMALSAPMTVDEAAAQLLSAVRPAQAE
ncbi:MAG: energy-coupling factor ABC transporter ATP-binding protein [Bacillota bacterium]